MIHAANLTSVTNDANLASNGSAAAPAGLLDILLVMLALKF